MNSKGIRNDASQHLISFVRKAGEVSLVTLTASSLVLTSCGRKSQEEEDVASLKLIGYDLDQIGFFNAVENDDISVLKVFKEHKFDLQQTDLKGRTALHVAAESGSIAALNYLLKHGASVDVTDAKGVTPLMVAAGVGVTSGRGENSELIQFLLDKGADVRTKDKIGKFPLIHALDGGSSRAIELLAGKSRELLDIGLLYASDQNKYESIPVLVRYGASVYARNSGKTGLMIAAERGHAEAVQALLTEGANMYAVSDEGMLARDLANGNENVLSVLSEVENEAGDEVLALEWSEEELEALVQKAMERSPEVDAGIEAVVGSVPNVKEVVAKNANDVASGNITESTVPSRAHIDVSSEDKKDAIVKRIRGKSLPLELADSAAVAKQVTMTAYAEKSLPVQVKAVDEGRVEVYDLRANSKVENANPVVTTGSKIGMTGLRVKQIKKRVVNNKLTGGQAKELVTLMVEDERSGRFRELYAGYESQAADAVAVLRMNETGEHLVVERDDEFYDLKGTAYKVLDVSDTEVIIENTSTSQVALLPLMGVKR